MSAEVSSGPTFRRVLRSEWTKVSSANWAVLIALPVVFSALSGWIGHTNHDQPTEPSLTVGGGFLLFAIAIGVFGLTMMTGEFHSGLIRTTFTAVPRRLPVLWAKAVVLIAVALPVLLIGYFGAFLAYQAFTDSALRITLGEPEIIRALFGAVAATTAAGLMALGLGTVLRSTAGAISAYVLVSGGAALGTPRRLARVLPVGRDAVLSQSGPAGDVPGRRPARADVLARHRDRGGLRVGHPDAGECRTTPAPTGCLTGG